MKKYSTKNLPKKISNLLLLKKKFLVPKFYFYLFAKYKINKKEILNKVRKEFTNVIIRSAYSEEDQDGLSNAGKFLSIPNIKSIDALKLDLSINKVVNSYKMQNPQNQYFLDSNVDTHNKLNQLLNVQKFFKPFSYKGSNF